MYLLNLEMIIVQLAHKWEDGEVEEEGEGEVEATVKMTKYMDILKIITNKTKIIFIVVNFHSIKIAKDN